MITSRIEFLVRRLRERLWVKPLAYCILAVIGALLAHAADFTKLASFVPEITTETLKTLLSIISNTMLAVATFAVASMISAYASASRSATPRAFALVVADDTSQLALSSFIGAFIFSIVATIAVTTGYYGKAGHFVLFLMVLMTFAVVIVTFVRWVDSIARLGRMGTTIETVEAAATEALERRRLSPNLGGQSALDTDGDVAGSGKPLLTAKVGYIQHLEMEALQHIAEKSGLKITIASLPGSFIGPGKPLAFLEGNDGEIDTELREELIEAFLIGNQRTYDEDPRFGLIVLSEIAARALSPGINDPGTAIAIVGTMVRLFASWARPLDDDDDKAEILFDRVYVPELSCDEMFSDAFTAIARDGAEIVEVGVRLQKAFLALTQLESAELTKVAKSQSESAFSRAEKALVLPSDLEKIKVLVEKVQGA
ncbi:DUF2254 domain-containing protein [Pararhizobium sp. IMCC21322]|uniref:DUF2254 domain-containing protein n=1 Tax=Pararhizobium sp. IMCC21322 TaxID=3067903 RepID=UPI002740DBFC|nr:DUF2254 domain-containing protein [Pararhizobium sp. IMCC21322]